MSKRLRPVFPRWLTLLLAVLGVFLVGLIDWLTGIEISFSIFYLLPICLVAWFGGWIEGVVTATLAGLTWLVVDLIGSHYSSPVVHVWNGMVRYGFFLVVTLLLVRIRKLNGSLEDQVAARTAALQAEMIQRQALEQEASDISLKEQERIAQELHDQVAGTLGGLAFRAKALSQSLERQASPGAAAAKDLVLALNEVTNQIRSFARLLAPVEGATLETALTQLSVETRQAFGTSCSVEVRGVAPLTPDQGSHLFRIAQEGVRNAIQHADPQQIDLGLLWEDGVLELTVRNDGKGWNGVADASQGLGLRIMRHRARVLGGELSFRIDNLGRTVLSCRVPLEPGPAAKSASGAAFPQLARTLASKPITKPHSGQIESDTHSGRR